MPQLPPTFTPHSKIKKWWQRQKLHPAQREKGAKNDPEAEAPWETDYELLVCEGLFDEYLEMGESISSQDK